MVPESHQEIINAHNGTRDVAVRAKYIAAKSFTDTFNKKILNIQRWKAAFLPICSFENCKAEKEHGEWLCILNNSPVWSIVASLFTQSFSYSASSGSTLGD